MILFHAPLGLGCAVSGDVCQVLSRIPRPLCRRRRRKRVGTADCNIIVLPLPAVRGRCAAGEATFGVISRWPRPVPRRVSNRRPRPAGRTCPPTRASIPRGCWSNATALPRRWRSCGPWSRTIRTRRTCGFSWAWPPAGGPRNRDVGTRTARAPGRGHRGVPVHPDPPAGTGARAPGTGPGLLSEGGGPVGPRTISSGPWWAARPRPWSPTSTGF